jgi:hypothetical protein
VLSLNQGSCLLSILEAPEYPPRHLISSLSLALLPETGPRGHRLDTLSVKIATATATLLLSPIPPPLYWPALPPLVHHYLFHEC